MNLADFINDLPAPDENIPPEVEAKYNELTGCMQVCFDEAEIKGLLILNGKQEMSAVLEKHRGASFAFLRSNGWPSMVIALRVSKEEKIRLFTLALPPEKEDDAGPFFLSFLKAIQGAMGVEKIQSRQCMSPANN